MYVDFVVGNRGTVNSIIDYLNTIDDEILKEITVNKLHEDYNIAVDVLKSKLKKVEKEPVTLEVREIFKKSSTKSGYEKACEKILFSMMNDDIYIKMYQNLLGYIENPVYRNITNEIIYYHKINGVIDLADFISFVSEKLLTTWLMSLLNYCI